MAHNRAHLILPDDLLAEVDALIGPRGRSDFLTQAIREAVTHRRLLQSLTNPEPILNERDYPEFGDNSEAWVWHLREDDTRQEREKMGDWTGGGRSE